MSSDLVVEDPEFDLEVVQRPELELEIGNGGSGSGGTLTEIDPADTTITVTNPTGPIVAIKANVGTTTGTVAAGDDSRFGEPTTPIGSAGGDLAGSYPDPTVTQARGLRETAGPTTLAMGAVADLSLLVRSGTSLVGRLISAFTTKSVPLSTDEILLGDNAASGALKRATLSSLATAIGAASNFNPLTDIAPEFYYRMSNPSNTLTSGRYSTFAALGSDPTTFGTIGTQAPLQGTDSDGNVYAQFDGTAGVQTAMQQSAGASTFKFIHDGTTPWTIVLIHYYSPISGAGIYESILDNTGNSSANIGFELENSNDGGGSSHGPWFGLYSASAGIYVHSINGRQDITGQAQVPRKEIWIVRLWPTKDRTVAGGITTQIVENMMWRQGVLIGYSNRNGNYSTSNPTNLLTIGRSSTLATGKYWNGRLYELMICKRALSDRQIAGMCGYAASTYKIQA